MEEEKKPLLQEDNTPKKETRLSGFFKLNNDTYERVCTTLKKSLDETQIVRYHFQHPLVKDIGDAETPIYLIMDGMVVTDDGVNIHFFPVYINVNNSQYFIGSDIPYDKLPSECRTDMVLEKDFESYPETITYSEYQGELFLHYEYGTRVTEHDNDETCKVENYLRLINLNSKTLIQLI